MGDIPIWLALIIIVGLIGGLAGTLGIYSACQAHLSAQQRALVEQRAREIMARDQVQTTRSREL